MILETRLSILGTSGQIEGVVHYYLQIVSLQTFNTSNFAVITIDHRRDQQPVPSYAAVGAQSIDSKNNYHANGE
jgi:hypothetical protein